MDPTWVGGFRPSKIPIYSTDPGWGKNGNLYYSLRPSSFKMEWVVPTEHKWGPLRLRVEFDLFGMGVHAGETTVRFRFAYGDWGPFRIGKDWSTFIDLEAFPNIYDWWGPPGMALLPAPTLRFTHNFSMNDKLELALEIPGNSIDPGYLREVDPNLINVIPKEILPDFIARLTHRGNFGYVKTAVLLRRLEYDLVSINYAKAVRKSEFGWAVNITSGINTFNKKGVFRLQSVFGQGYASYNNDGGVELAPDSVYNAVVPFQYGLTAFYDFSINDKWALSAGYGETNYENSAKQTPDAFKRSQYVVTQLVYTVVKDKFLMGVNFQYGKKYVKEGKSADARRILINFTYKFSQVRD